MAEKKKKVANPYKIPKELPIIPLLDMVVFPNVILPLIITNEKLISQVNDVLSDNKIIGIFANKPDANGDYNYNDVYKVGTAVVILKMFRRNADSGVRLLVQGLSRIELKKIVQEEPAFIGRVNVLKEKIPKGIKIDALIRNNIETFSNIMRLSPNVPEDLEHAIKVIKNPSKLADLIGSNVHLNVINRQKLLEEVNVHKRLEILLSFLQKELKVLKLTSKIQDSVNEELEKDQKDYYLREQLRVIRKELGEEDDETQELADLQQKIKEKKLPKLALEAANRELKRLNRMSSASSEYTVARTYLDWILDLPWNDKNDYSIDLNKAKIILDEDHYGLVKIKERILEYLAVRKLKEDSKGSILCFAGPPGVGKTSLGKSIARAMGRKFVRASLGGVRDESEIRGHRRTYIGSLPGIIIKNLRQVGVNNPVMMLDEIDKLGISNQGDPASALLEALDPQQNKEFVDHYLDIPFDLSQIMFIMTANYLENIPAPLLDRMEIIELPSYLINEKAMIAKNYLIKRQIEQNGITKKDLKISQKAIEFIIQNYTREAGVRKLEQKIEKICRKIAFKKAMEEEYSPKIGIAEVKELLGNKYLTPELANRRSEIGITTGLAWSPSGGSILFIEASLMKGSGKVKITGSIGEVMRESAEIAISYIKSNAKALKINAGLLDNNDIHIHVPDGSTPKDGPSAGAALTTTLVSLFSKRPVKKEVAMTGEISLRGKVMEIGGLREKIIAAQKAGIKKVLIPKDNGKDLVDIPNEVLEKLTIVKVEHLDEVLEEALLKKK